MGQVPTLLAAEQPLTFSGFLIAGSGRLSRHFQRYFRLLDLPFSVWSRHDGAEQLAKLAQRASHVLIMLSDGAILPFVTEAHAIFHGRCLVHFAGGLEIQGVHVAHPLMTFSDELYSVDTYRKIPFVIDSTGPEFGNLLPGLANENFRIEPRLRPLYHAWCVMSGNFTTLLWQEFFGALERDFGLPAPIAHLYLRQTAHNLEQVASKQTASVLTGPLARGDRPTQEAHLKALQRSPMLPLYRSFQQLYQQLQTQERSHEIDI